MTIVAKENGNNNSKQLQVIEHTNIIIRFRDGTDRSD